jgi:hypothetical protein
MTKVSNKTLYIAGYGVLFIFSVVWGELNNLSFLMVLIANLPPLIADYFSTYNPKLLAYIYTHRRRLAFFLFLVCLIGGGITYFIYPFQKIYAGLSIQSKFILLTQFILQGTIVGFTLRMLLLNLFANMLKVKDIHKAKLLIMAAWVVFLIMFPVNESHRSLSSFFIIGFGFGFLLHYLVRTNENKKAQRNRLKENLFSMIAELKKQDSENQSSNESEEDIKSVQLTPIEEEAVNLFSRQDWSALKAFLKAHNKTTTLFFINLCMLRKLNQPEEALQLIREKIDLPNLSHKNYYHLHYALNESERFDYNGNWINKDNIFNHLEEAYKLNPDCLLTCATYALRIAGEIKVGDNNHQEEKEKALKLIWRAMKINEGKPIRKIVALATGMTIPLTYTFLLDTYGYVLLKNDKTRFAKALILQCVFQDPTFSATYLHLAELYYTYYHNNTSKKLRDRIWQRSAKFCLYIAIETEKDKYKVNKESLISTRAKMLLEKIP